MYEFLRRNFIHFQTKRTKSYIKFDKEKIWFLFKNNKNVLPNLLAVILKNSEIKITFIN